MEVGKTLFGDDFTDKTSEQIDQKQIEMMEKFGRMMLQPNSDYMRPTMEEISAFNKWLEEHGHYMNGQGIFAMPRNFEQHANNMSTYSPYDDAFAYYDDDGYNG